MPSLTPRLNPAVRAQDALVCNRQAILATMDALIEQVTCVAQLVDDGERAEATDECARLGTCIDQQLACAHRDILLAFVRHAPKARDLRVLTGLLHVCKHIERASVQCRDIVKLVDVAREGHVDDHIESMVREMCAIANSQIVEARVALDDEDPYAILSLRQSDGRLNELNRAVFRAAVASGDDLATRQWAMSMTMVARALERIGDNAVDIGIQTSSMQ